jgi:flagellin FlaB
MHIVRRGRRGYSSAEMGVGSLIIFIAMILVAGIAASVLIQTVNTLQNRALETSQQTLQEVSSGLEVTHVSGYSNGSKITQLAVFLQTTAASEPVNLSSTVVALSDGSKKVILSYDHNRYSASASGGLFGTINASALTSTTFGLLVIRDIDGSCAQLTPALNSEDIAVLIVNTSKCFGGIAARAQVAGDVMPESGISGSIGFTTPTSLKSTILDLQP